MANTQVKDSVEQRVSSACHIKIGERSYDMNFKLRVISDRLLNSFVFLNVMYSVGKRWQKDEKFKSASASRKTFRGPKTGKFNNLNSEYLLPNTFTGTKQRISNMPRSYQNEDTGGGT